MNFQSGYVNANVNNNRNKIGMRAEATTNQYIKKKN